MGVVEEIIAAAEDGTLTADERRRLIRRLRAEEWERLRAALPVSRTFTATIRGVQRSVTVTVTALERDDGIVTLVGSDTRNLIDWPIRVVNPPLLYPDPLGPIVRVDDDGTEHRYRLDAAAVLRDLVRDLARSAARRRFSS